MHKLHEVKYMLMEELETHAEDGKVTAQSLDEIDKLAHALKNVCKVIETCEEEDYSSRGYYSRDGGMSTRRGRDRMGRFTSRDEGPDMSMDRSMDGRSYDGMSRSGSKEQTINMLKNYLNTEADERTRGRVRELIRDMQNS